MNQCLLNIFPWMFYRCHGLNIDQAELFVLPPDLLPLPSPRHQTVVNASSLSSPLGAVSQHSSPHPWEQSPSIHLLTPRSSLSAFPLFTPRSSLPAFPLLTPGSSLPAKPVGCPSSVSAVATALCCIQATPISPLNSCHWNRREGAEWQSHMSFWKNDIAVGHDKNWLESTRINLVEDSTPSRPWALLYPRCNTLAQHRPMTVLRATIKD